MHLMIYFSHFEGRKCFVMGRKHVFQEASGGRGAGKDWTKSLKNCQKMSHEDELNRDDCSLSAFVWYQTLLLPPLLTPLFVISLYNYSSYGISNTPDIFQCQQDQNQPWETVFYMYNFNSNKAVR